VVAKNYEEVIYMLTRFSKEESNHKLKKENNWNQKTPPKNKVKKIHP